jgi:hypothetical protein
MELDPEFLLFHIWFTSSYFPYFRIHILFIDEFKGYSTMERAVYAGEVVTCKGLKVILLCFNMVIIKSIVNIRLLSSLPSYGYGNAFLLLDLHVSGLFN